MDCVNPIVLYYIQCRDRQNEPCAKILNECRQLFSNYAPKSLKSIRNLIELKQESYSFNDFKTECLDTCSDIKSLKFKIDQMCEIPKKVLYYICCRYQLKSKLQFILDDLYLLYPNHQISINILEQAISKCFQLDENNNDKITQLTNVNHTIVEVKTELIEQIIETTSINYSTNLTTYNMQEQIELADLENANLKSIINKLENEKNSLINELDKVLTEFDLFKSEKIREILKLNHSVRCLQDANKCEAENNMKLNSKLTKFSHEISEAVSEISRLNDQLNDLKEKNKNLQEERDKIWQDNVVFDKNMKKLIERDNMHRDRLDQATNFLKQFKKEIDDLKKENQELKTSSSRVEYLKHLNETSKFAKELKERSDQNECLKKQYDDLNEKLKQTVNELTAKTNAWIDQANTIKQMDIQILNLKAVNIDLETRLNSKYYNIYASNYYQSTNYNNFNNKKNKRRFKPDFSSNEQNQALPNKSQQLAEKSEKIQKLMDIKILNDDMEIENPDEVETPKQE